MNNQKGTVYEIGTEIESKAFALTLSGREATVDLDVPRIYIWSLNDRKYNFNHFNK